MSRTPLVLMGLAGCASVLDLDDRHDAIAELCTCDAQLPAFEDCRQVLSQRLAQVSEPTREAWLAFFVDNCSGGDAACDNAFACYQQPGTCSPTSCSTDEECCDFAAGKRCREGQCVACTLAGDPCGDTAECCSGLVCNGSCTEE